MSTLLRDIHSQIVYFPRAIVLSVVLLPGYLFFTTDKSQRKESIISALRQPWLLLYLIYLSFLLVSTLFSRPPTNPLRNVLNNFGLYNVNGVNMECIENTLLFVPYSFFYLQTSRYSSPFKSALVVSICTTMFIEFSQLIFWLGEFQVSDLLHNVIGGMIGFVLWHIKEVLIYK